MCSIIIYFNPETGCLCSLNEGGEFTISVLLSGGVPSPGDLIIVHDNSRGAVAIYNFTQDRLMDIDIRYHTRSERYARNIIRTLAASSLCTLPSFTEAARR